MRTPREGTPGGDRGNQEGDGRQRVQHGRELGGSDVPRDSLQTLVGGRHEVRTRKRSLA